MFSEQDVDRELKAALSVSPSADFEARVLQRVEKDRPMRVGLFGVGRFRADRFTVGGGLKTPALLAAAATLVIVAGLFYALNRTPVVQRNPAPQIVEHVPPLTRTPLSTAAAPRATPVTPAVTPVERPVAATVHASRRATRAAKPEVIVPVNQMEAVRRLVRAVNAGRLDAVPPAPDTPAATPDDVLVKPLVVEPLMVPTLEAVLSMPPVAKAIDKE